MYQTYSAMNATPLPTHVIVVHRFFELVQEASLKGARKSRRTGEFTELVLKTSKEAGCTFSAENKEHIAPGQLNFPKFPYVLALVVAFWQTEYQVQKNNADCDDDNDNLGRLSDAEVRFGSVLDPSSPNREPDFGSVLPTAPGPEPDLASGSQSVRFGLNAVRTLLRTLRQLKFPRKKYEATGWLLIVERCRGLEGRVIYVREVCQSVVRMDQANGDKGDHAVGLSRYGQAVVKYDMLTVDGLERVAHERQRVMTAMVIRRWLSGKELEPRTEPLVPQVEPNLNLNRTAGSVRFGPGPDALPDRTAASLGRLEISVFVFEEEGGGAGLGSGSRDHKDLSMNCVSSSSRSISAGSEAKLKSGGGVADYRPGSGSINWAWSWSW
ncbi:hypothetical protein SISNIDRAFT_461703 [Sistotremastrum niveocremeum HHB9708]|uniref:Uncharacterized protein n=1 Tax=Sistotremastrum niveocremeum HHB9708 TaxID=1314777 RepID=A0A165AAS2_9AGAM|nr:hypothetical protein SISNIDRAFT_461703 [Sistotremastrum niveocremeum HHB9708]